MPDADEGTSDYDSDGLPDYLDPDSDGDGVPNGSESKGDSDTDGVPDYLDPDSDEDGLPDAQEAGRAGDPNYVTINPGDNMDDTPPFDIHSRSYKYGDR